MNLDREVVLYIILHDQLPWVCATPSLWFWPDPNAVEPPTVRTVPVPSIAETGTVTPCTFGLIRGPCRSVRTVTAACSTSWTDSRSVQHAPSKRKNLGRCEGNTYASEAVENEACEEAQTEAENLVRVLKQFGDEIAAPSRVRSCRRGQTEVDSPGRTKTPLYTYMYNNKASGRILSADVYLVTRYIHI